MRDDGIPERLKRVEQDIFQMKMTQPLAGDAWKVYKGVSENEWDINILAGETDATYRQIFKVRYNTADANSENAFAYITYRASEDSINGGLWYSTQPDANDPLSIFVLVKAGFGWSSSSVMKIKFYAFSPYRGAISVEQV